MYVYLCTHATQRIVSLSTRISFRVAQNRRQDTNDGRRDVTQSMQYNIYMHVCVHSAYCTQPLPYLYSLLSMYALMKFFLLINILARIIFCVTYMHASYKTTACVRSS